MFILLSLADFLLVRKRSQHYTYSLLSKSKFFKRKGQEKVRKKHDFSVDGSQANEMSKADVCNNEMNILIANAFQDIIDKNPNISLRDLYCYLAQHTVGSHASVYNIENYGNMYSNSMTEFLK